jgi:hypothetical protein
MLGNIKIYKLSSNLKRISLLNNQLCKFNNKKSLSHVSSSSHSTKATENASSSSHSTKATENDIFTPIG